MSGRKNNREKKARVRQYRHDNVGIEHWNKPKLLIALNNACYFRLLVVEKFVAVKWVESCRHMLLGFMVIGFPGDNSQCIAPLTVTN